MFRKKLRLIKDFKRILFGKSLSIFSKDWSFYINRT